MSKKLQITIPTPCHENWDSMSQEDKGRFCNSCQKVIMDFSTMSDRQVAEFFKKPSTGTICGRFNSEQLEHDIDIPRKRAPWLRYLFQMILPAFFLSKASAQKIGKVATVCRDTSRVMITEQRVTMGIAVAGISPFEKDTVKTERLITGTIIDEKNNGIPYASVQAGRGSNIVFANEKGEFSIRLKEELPLIVSSSGYESEQIFAGIGKENLTIQLAASIGEGDIEVSSALTGKMGNVSVLFVDTTATAPTSKIESEIPKPNNNNRFSLYPNPVLSGTNVSLGVQLLDEGYYTVQFMTITGQLIKQMEIWIDKDARLLSLDVPKTSAGNYFFVLINKKSGKKFTEKISIE